MLKVGWLTSGRGPGSLALLTAACDAIERGELPIEIAYVFCNRARGEHAPADVLLDLAESRGLHVVALSSATFRRHSGGTPALAGQPLPEWRWDYDRAIWDLVRPLGPCAGVLAGYQLIAPELCQRMDLINLHPAAPGGPVGLWQEVIWQLIATRATESGITIFRAIPELDAGPALSFCRYSLSDLAIDALWQQENSCDVDLLRRDPGEDLPLFREIRRRGAERETPLLLATLSALASGLIELRPTARGDALPAPLNLSNEVEQAVAAGG